jgi:hypothetical protein
MKYLLLVYGHETWDRLPAEETRSLHRAHRALHEARLASAPASARVTAHYRVRSPDQATTIRRVDGESARTEGPSGGSRDVLRALYLVESDDHDGVVDLATTLPALRIGGAAEIWPLAEPKPL